MHWPAALFNIRANTRRLANEAIHESAVVNSGANCWLSQIYETRMDSY